MVFSHQGQQVDGVSRQAQARPGVFVLVAEVKEAEARLARVDGGQGRGVR